LIIFVLVVFRIRIPLIHVNIASEVQNAATKVTYLLTYLENLCVGPELIFMS